LLSLEDNRNKKITLSCTVIDAEHVELTVMDNGRGIAPEVLKKMFTFGFTTKVNGHGYGMHNSYLAAKALGGSLTVSSDGVGCGAKFTLTIMNQPVD
jgi:C4-dicarboxylate-specific signal transduction histidine kinase